MIIRFLLAPATWPAIAALIPVLELVAELDALVVLILQDELDDFKLSSSPSWERRL
jgi:hypothetical protein